MTGYVHLKQPESLLQLANQIGVPSGKTRIRADGEIEAQFFPLNRGDYVGPTWLTRDQIF